MHNIFVGNSLSVLAVAALMSKKGHRVAVFPSVDTPCALPLPTLDFALGPLLLMGFEEQGAAEQFFQELSLPISSLKKKGLIIQRCTPLLQLVQSDHRMDLSSQREEYLEDLKREFKDQMHGIYTLFETIQRQAVSIKKYGIRPLPKEQQTARERLRAWHKDVAFRWQTYQQNRRGAATFLKSFSLEADFIEHLNLLSLFVFRKTLHSISKYQLIVLLSELQGKGVRIVGGYPKLITFLLKLIKEWGGEVYEERRIEKMEMEGEKAHRITLDDGSSVICRNMLLTQVSSSPSSPLTVTFYLKIKKEYIPSLMRENMVMTWGVDVPPCVYDGLILRLSFPDEEKKIGSRVLTVTALLRSRHAPSSEEIDALKALVMNRLRWLIPFSESGIQEIGVEISVGRLPTQPFSLNGVAEVTREVCCGMRHYLRSKMASNVFIGEDSPRNGLEWSTLFSEAIMMAPYIGKVI